MMQIAIPLYDRFTALDAVGPYEVLSRIPDSKLTFVGYEVGPVRTDNERLAMHVDAVFEDIPEPDVIVVPGGWGTRALLDDERILSWIRHAHEHSQWTTSVCTGSLLLGAAGVLDGLKATSHWLELEALADYGAAPTGQRVVEQGKVITAAGVSSGIDMGLTLLAKIAGDEFAQTIQLLIEYDPEPPFDSGSPDEGRTRASGEPPPARRRSGCGNRDSQGSSSSAGIASGESAARTGLLLGGRSVRRVGCPSSTARRSSARMSVGSSAAGSSLSAVGSSSPSGMIVTGGSTCNAGSSGSTERAPRPQGGWTRRRRASRHPLSVIATSLTPRSSPAPATM